MKIKELKELIKDLPDRMIVCGVGHYGEELKIDGGRVRKVSVNYDSQNDFDAFVLDMENAGEEPD